jgi:hypothetical protein
MAKKTPAGKTREPDPEAIAQLAYKIYLHRVAHHLPGNSESDWHEAREQLMDRH